ncbi:alpha/beta hydrolase fold domain-containing protein [Novosphingobium sp.]|uniref:alpha/beta hydrolase fold domain-containing protein n=1 Tax=Novosphingobium sp. TaxID=1874826 RepID=UPI002FDF82C5
MRIGIIGGGIGGLAAAIALRKIGLEPIVYEQATAFGSVGAGIVLAPNTMRALDWLGAGDHIRAINSPLAASTYNNLTTGEEIFRTVLGERAAQRWGRHLYTTHRSDLVQALAACLPSESLCLAKRVEYVREHDTGVTVAFADGGREQFDLLIGADGLKSSVRATLGVETDAIFTGYLAWRTTFDASRLRRKPSPETAVWGGPGRHVVRYPIRKGTELYTAFYVPAAEIHRETWEVSGDIADLRASFRDCCEDVADTLAAVDKAFITGIFYRSPLDRWHSRRIVLTGDAAHSVLPTSGSGSGLALEDAVVLARSIEQHGIDRAEEAFAAFQERRWARATRIQAASRVDLEAFHETDLGRIAARDGRYRGMARIDPMGELKWSWIYSYDAVAEADLSIEQVAPTDDSDPPARGEALKAFDMWRTALSIEDRARGWIGQREGYARFLEGLTGSASNFAVEPISCDGVPALRVVPEGGEAGPCILHLHGGGFIFGSAIAAVPLAARLAEAAGGWAIVPDYRLAPENPYPAAIDDVRQVWTWLEEREIDAALSGECAGGGLALALARWLAENKRRSPRLVALFSPFLDPLLKADSIDRNARRDPWMSRPMLTEMAGSYLQDSDPASSALSLEMGELRSLPPLRIWSATSEALHDDAIRLAEQIAASGGDVKAVAVEDSVPSFVLFDFLPETRTAIQDFGNEVADLFHRHCPAGNRCSPHFDETPS